MGFLASGDDTGTGKADDIVNINRIQRYREGYASHLYKHDQFDPPLKIVTAVVSRWGPGDKFEYVRKKVTSLNLVTLGNACFRQNGRSGTVASGEFFLAHRGSDQCFKTGSAGFLHKRTLLVEGALLDSFMRTTGLSDRDVVKPHDLRHAMGLVRRSYGLLHSKPEGFVLELSNLAHCVLLELARSIAVGYPLPVQSTIEYLRRNLDRPLTLKAMARESGLSVRHFSRLFSEATRMSPSAFFAALKMELAENMLVNSGMSVKQIAGALGYEDPFHFSLQFKRHAGVSPKKFRDPQV